MKTLFLLLLLTGCESCDADQEVIQTVARIREEAENRPCTDHLPKKDGNCYYGSKLKVEDRVAVCRCEESK